MCREWPKDKTIERVLGKAILKVHYLREKSKNIATTKCLKFAHYNLSGLVKLLLAQGARSNISYYISFRVSQIANHFFLVHCNLCLQKFFRAVI